MNWVNCKDCVCFQERDCDNTESRDGCYFGIIEDEDEMKKQYVLHRAGAFRSLVVLYNNGREIYSHKCWDDELSDYIDKIKADGYEKAFEEDEVEKARKEYEYLLAHKLYQIDN
jgi:hypothetical protein